MKPSPVFSAPDDMSGVSTTRNPSSASRQDGDQVPPGYNRLKFRLTGVTPLIMHRGGLANPLDHFAKEMKRISAKRAKTEADYEELARIEFIGSLYTTDGEPCLPGEVLEAALVEAAKKMRRGNQARVGIVCGHNARLEYHGPHTPEGLWADERFRLSVGVRIQKNRVIRTRPIFREWGCFVLIDFVPTELNKSEIIEIIETAGARVGVGDWRPRFGRFTAETL